MAELFEYGRIFLISLTVIGILCFIFLRID